MLKNKQQNVQGVKTTRFRGTFRKFVMALTVMIFILGLGFIIYQKFNNKGEIRLSQTETAKEIPGWWYQKYFGLSTCGNDSCKPEADPDADKLTNSQEYFYNTNPTDSHTIKDDLDDGQLVANGFDPSRPGRMTFEQVLSDDNILGESLVFNSDIKDLINEAVDPNKVVIPQISDDEIKIITNVTEESLTKYVAEMQDIMAIFPKDLNAYITASVQSGNPEALSDVQKRFRGIAARLKEVEVPVQLVQLHKYNISLMMLLPDVIAPPTDDILLDDTNPIGNSWYDKTQIAFVLYQKITLEMNRLGLQ